MNEPLLLIPGPTNLSKRVRDVMAGPQLAHTGKQFYADFTELLGLARYVFKNEKGFQFVFTGSGTIGMESSVVSTVSHGDMTLTVSTGYFGQRMLMLNQVHGAKADAIAYPDGRHADPDDLRKKLRTAKYKVVFVTHVDTSTSVVNPIRELVEECRNAGVFSVVDSVCGVGGVPLDFDRLGADIAFTASQKALAGAPGAVLVATSREILEYFEKRETPIESYYMSLLRWKPIMDDPRIYLATPAVQVLLALREALLEAKAEGIENRWERHRRLGEMVRGMVSGDGLGFVADEGFRSDTVTGFWVKDGTAGDVQRKLEEESGILVARGLHEMKDKMIRIGHFGILTEPKLKEALGSLHGVLVELGAAKPKAAARHK
ncbi:MAG TPA: alanine--glyoxylate aminotransferase family protein [Nitrososphaerales archaeon]|nr:alanine--glyoxylate aminotransferase family protein [Nitrososphaerales archaeon]